MKTLLPFASDYMEGAYPAILERLSAINTIPQDGYGTDGISETARQKILEACHCPDGEVHFLSGGTQTNAVVIDAILRRYEASSPSPQATSAFTKPVPSNTRGTRSLNSPSIKGSLPLPT